MFLLYRWGSVVCAYVVRRCPSQSTDFYMAKELCKIGVYGIIHLAPKENLLI